MDNQMVMLKLMESLSPMHPWRALPSLMQPLVVMMVALQAETNQKWWGLRNQHPYIKPPITQVRPSKPKHAVAMHRNPLPALPKKAHGKFVCSLVVMVDVPQTQTDQNRCELEKQVS
jgi:hypothetical protein